MSGRSERDWMREVGLDPNNPTGKVYLHKGADRQKEFGSNKYLLPSVSLEAFAADTGEGADWVWEGLLAKGELTDLAGLAKQGGKTTFTCCGISAAARDDTHAGLETKPVKYLYLTEQGNNFSEAIDEAGLMEHPDAMRIVQYKDVAGTAWDRLIADAAQDAKSMGADVVVVDTFATFSGLVDGDENLAGPVGQRMRAARLAAQQHNVAILIIRHSGKDGRPRGSSSFEAEADICATLSRPEGRHDPRVRKLAVMGRHGVWERNVQLLDGRFITLGTDDRVEFKKALAFVKDTLPESPDAEMKKRDLLALRGEEQISNSTITRALEWLIKEGAVGQKQIMNARGKPKVYWLARQGPEDPDAKKGGRQDLPLDVASPTSSATLRNGTEDKLGSENPEADKNNETRVGTRKGIYLNQTTPLYVKGEINKPSNQTNGQRAGAQAGADVASPATGATLQQGTEDKSGSASVTRPAKPSLAAGGSAPGVAEGGNDVVGLGAPAEATRRIRRLVRDGWSEYAARAEVLAKDHPLDCECAVCA